MSPMDDGWTHRWSLESESDTQELGECLATLLVAGDVLALTGDLGVGKTRLVRAISSGLKVDTEQVSSPTFSLIQEYSGRLLVRHCDTYRLRDPREFADLGLDELFAEDGVAIVEWAERVREFLPRGRLELELRASGPTTREVRFRALGRRSEQLLKSLSDRWQQRQSQSPAS